MYIFNFSDDLSVVGSSPEALVKVTGDNVMIHPIAGTRARNADAKIDQQVAQSLLEDPKERAEHLMLVDLRPFNVKGNVTAESLSRANITCNKNTVPNDTEKPFITSGVRLGTPAITTRGFQKEDMKTIAQCIYNALMNPENDVILEQVRSEVKELTSKYPLNY